MAIIGEVISATVNNRGKITVLVDIKKNATVLQSKEFTFSFGDYPDVNALKAAALEELSDYLEQVLRFFWEKNRNLAEVQDLVDQAVGYTKSITSAIISMGDEQWEIHEDGTWTVL